MIKIGIVGSGEDKFTEDSELKARSEIVDIIERHKPCTVVSGDSPEGGIDIWSEEIALSMEQETDIKSPKIHRWNPVNGYGYKARNLDIAESDIVYVIVADKYPTDYPEQKKFKLCYHCKTTDHVKSGACWTAKQALKLGKEVHWVVIKNE